MQCRRLKPRGITQRSPPMLQRLPIITPPAYPEAPRGKQYSSTEARNGYAAGPRHSLLACQAALSDSHESRLRNSATAQARGSSCCRKDFFPDRAPGSLTRGPATGRSMRWELFLNCGFTATATASRQQSGASS